MNNELRPYDEYKETGVFWLDYIPNGWDWRYLSQIAGERCLKNRAGLEDNVLSLSYGNIIRKKNIDFGLVPKEYSNYQIVKDGNIILRLTDLQNDKRSLRTGLVNERGIITSAYTCLDVKRDSPKFVHYVLHAFDLMKVFYGMGGGVRQSIGYQDIRKLRIPIPPREEQDQIVRYLDYKLAKINKFIKAKKKLIAVLKEQKQAIINQAVTKGLDPDVKMKPSGIEWLGDVPEHWIRVRVKSIVHNISNNVGDSNGKQYIGLENVESWSGKIINLNPNFTFESQAKTFQSGDILFGKLRPYLAKVCIPDFEGVCSGEFLVLKNKNHGLSNNFIQKLLRSSLLIDLITSSTYGAKMPRADWGFIGNISIFIPNKIEEQTQISNYISKIEESIDKEVSLIEREMLLVNEYKTSLVSNVVTGQIDVRKFEILEIERDYDHEEDFDLENEEEDEEADELIDEGGDE